MRNSFFCLLFSLTAAPMALASNHPTPLEASGWETLSSHADMLAFFEHLADASPAVTMREIGTSVSGRSIPALYFSRDARFASQRDEKPLVLINCQQHGNEPSGKEAAMIVARRLLAEDAALLEKLDLILVPQVNPDGSESGQRRNANDMDLNRNHVVLSEPESRALHELFLDWMPEISLDVHEYNAVLDSWIEQGYIKDAEEMLGGVTNLNVDPEILRFTREVFIPETGEGIEADGFRFHRYMVGDPFREQVFRYSTTAINDARQSMGIYNTFSFIIEGKRYGNLTNEIERRTKGQVSAIINFLETASRHAGDLLSITRRARARMADRPRIDVQMEYFPQEGQPTEHFPVFELSSWTHTDREIEHFKPRVMVKKSVERPAAYAIPARETRLIDLLKRHRIPMRVLAGDQAADTESYLVRHITVTVDEEKPAFLLDLDTSSRRETLAAGTVIVPVAGPSANLLPLLLEPESTWGIVAPRSMLQYRFEDYLVEGQPYPVKRLRSIDGMETGKLE